MNRDPVLAARSFAPGHDGYKVPLVLRVEGGLHYLRGNDKPYFSLTYTQHRKGFPEQCYSGGAGHEYILKYFPRFADLAALHLSDIDGVPMHAASNGWYNMAGALGGAGERYHVGNSKRNFPVPPPPDKPWLDYEHRLPTGEECLQFFADYVRISIDEARVLRNEMLDEYGNNPDGWQAAKATLALRIEDMKPRWKQEADACIERHHLVVFGDQWPPVDALGRVVE